MLPLLLAQGALKIGGDLLSARAQARAARSNARAAYANQATELNTLTLRGVQEQQAATGVEQIAGRKIQMDESVGSLAASENGVTGNSVAALHNELETQRGMYNDSVAENLSNQLQQNTQDKAGVIARTTARVNSVKAPSTFATGLKIAGDALSTFSAMGANSPAAGGDAVPAAAGSMGGPAMSLTPNLSGLSIPMGNVAPQSPFLNLKING